MIYILIAPNLSVFKKKNPLRKNQIDGRMSFFHNNKTLMQWNNGRLEINK